MFDYDSNRQTIDPLWLLSLTGGLEATYKTCLFDFVEMYVDHGLLIEYVCLILSIKSDWHTPFPNQTASGILIAPPSSWHTEKDKLVASHWAVDNELYLESLALRRNSEEKDWKRAEYNLFWSVIAR